MLEAKSEVEVVPTFKPPAKTESEVVVERRLPTVNWEVVAIKALPVELETMIEFAGKTEVPVPPLAVERVPAETVPFEAERAPEREPMTKVPVVVKLPPTVEEAAVTKPPVK